MKERLGRKDVELTSVNFSVTLDKLVVSRLTM